jgi:hypothetical protein
VWRVASGSAAKFVFSDCAIWPVVNYSCLLADEAPNPFIGEQWDSSLQTIIFPCDHVHGWSLCHDMTHRFYCKTGKFQGSKYLQISYCSIFASWYFRESMQYFLDNIFVCWENHSVACSVTTQSRPISWFTFCMWDVFPHTCVNTWWVGRRYHHTINGAISQCLLSQPPHLMLPTREKVIRASTLFHNQ